MKHVEFDTPRYSTLFVHQRLHLRSNFFDNIHSLLRPGHHLKPSVRLFSIMMPLHSVPSTLQLMGIFHTDIPQWVKPRRKHRRRRHSLQVLVLQTLHTQRNILERRRHPPGQIMVRKRGKIPSHPRYNPPCRSPVPAGVPKDGDPGLRVATASAPLRSFFPSSRPAKARWRPSCPHPPSRPLRRRDRDRRLESPPPSPWSPVDDGGVFVELGWVEEFGGGAVIRWRRSGCVLAVLAWRLLSWLLLLLLSFC